MKLLILLLAVTASLWPAEDITGIWTGQTKGRNDELEDIAFRFKQDGERLTGTMFGDEFDLPIEEGSLQDGKVRFVITTTNYYSNNKSRSVLTGIVKGAELELTRERIPGPDEKPATVKQIIKLKRAT